VNDFDVMAGMRSFRAQRGHGHPPNEVNPPTPGEAYWFLAHRGLVRWLVAGIAAEHDLPFLVISAGTRNHFAMDLGLDRDNPAACLDALTGDGVEQRIDLGIIGGRTFVNNASFGAYAEIVESPAYRDDKRGTTLQMLPEPPGRSPAQARRRLADAAAARRLHSSDRQNVVYAAAAAAVMPRSRNRSCMSMRRVS
jgi:hypothetical protein